LVKSTTPRRYPLCLSYAYFCGHFWTFVPDKKGFCFIVNVCSGRVLDVADRSLNNYATIQQRPFDGENSQRWRE
jgi:hypothetical protein